MPKPQLIGPVPGRTPTALSSAPGRRLALPDDLLRDATRRLGIMSLVGATLWGIGTLLGHVVGGLVSPGDPRWAELQPTDAIAGASMLSSFAVFWFTRRTRQDPQRVLDLGLGYMVLMAFALGLMLHWDGPPPGYSVRAEISWVGAVVLMSAAIVPTHPVKMLVVGLLAVSMNPVSMLIAQARGGWDFGPPRNALVMHYPDYLLVGVAVVISYVVTRLGQQVTRARELGSYQLGELLGRGGMGEVYRATHRMLARPAAIKLIQPEALGAREGEAADVVVRRFHREAAVAANLRSPHTVELYDFGVTDGQTLYYVMELLEGMDLESLVREHGPLPAGRTTYLLRQVCDSLEEAHVQGLVHRDIKPANIHVGRLGLQHDFVKVLDFGLVKSVDGASGEHSLATVAGLIIGTPAYMAPEMALGEAVDGRADLYALGCVAYYLLTGLLVFEATSAFQLMAKHLQQAPLPPSQRAGVEIPSALEQLVLACLAKRPDDRPRSAAELAQALAAVDAEPWGEAQAAEWWRTHHPAQDTGARTISALAV